MSHTRGRILIVEDDEGASILLSRRLERFGHRVHTVKSADEAFQAVESAEFDMLIFDYTLGSSQTGLDLYLVLKERGYALPAILVTGFGDENLILRALRAGVRDFLPKNTNYFDELPIIVERVLRQVQLEKDFHQSELLREKQDQLRQAFEAAKLGYLDWNIETGTLTWSGFHQELFGFEAVEVVAKFEDFIAQAAEEDVENLRSALEKARTNYETFNISFRMRRPSADGEHWIRLIGGFRETFPRGNRNRMTAIVLDVTKEKLAERELHRSMERIQTLNERLRLSVTESHHRVKNSLQTLSSLVHLQEDEVVKNERSAEVLRKISGQIQGIAAVHEVLTKHSRETEEELPRVSLNEFVERLVRGFESSYKGRPVSLSLDESSDIKIGGRQASSLAVTLNELMSNGVKHGNGKMWLKINLNSGARAEVIFSNEGSTFPEEFQEKMEGKTGLFLLRTLCMADFGSSPEFFNSENGHATVSFSIPVEDDSDLSKSVAH